MLKQRVTGMRKIINKVWGILNNVFIYITLTILFFVFVVDWNNLKTMDYVVIILLIILNIMIVLLLMLKLIFKFIKTLMDIGD